MADDNEKDDGPPQPPFGAPPSFQPPKPPDIRPPDIRPPAPPHFEPPPSAPPPLDTGPPAQSPPYGSPPPAQSPGYSPPPGSPPAPRYGGATDNPPQQAPYNAPPPQYNAPAPQYGAPSQYGGPPPGQYPAPPPSGGYQPGYAPQQFQVRKTNGLAIASLVLGILWVYWLGSILALIFGYIAKNQIDNADGGQDGRGLAVAGIVLGWIGVATLVIVIIVALATA